MCKNHSVCKNHSGKAAIRNCSESIQTQINTSLRSAFIKSSQSGHFVINETEIMYIYHANLCLEQFRKIFFIRTGCYKIANSFDDFYQLPWVTSSLDQKLFHKVV